MPVARPDSAPEPAAPCAGRNGSTAASHPQVPATGGQAGSEEDVHTQAHGVPEPEPPRSTRTLTEAGELLRALAAPVRIAIVLQLRLTQRCVHELVDALGVAQPLISQHLRVLKSAGVVRGERHGREVVYSLVDEHLAHVVVDAVAHAEETDAVPGDGGPERGTKDEAEPNAPGDETETA